jgi:hypothetical protein
MKFQNIIIIITLNPVYFSYFVKIPQWFGLSTLWGRYSLDLSKVYDFKFHIFVHPIFGKDTFGLNYMLKDALFDFHFFQNILDSFFIVTQKKKKTIFKLK